MTDDRGSLLVVDDNDANRDMLSRRLARRGYAVAVAATATEAMTLIASSSFDLVLLDVMMPGIDGLTMLQEVRQTRSATDLPIIMATARDRSEDIVRALALGANDYVTKPLDFAVVLARVRTHLSLTRATSALRAAHARMKRDLDAAARVQRALVPSAAPAVDGVTFAWLFEPCDELAGDILDVFPLDKTRVGLYLIDVSGHGVPSALLSVTLSRVLSHMPGHSLLVRDTVLASGDSLIIPPADVAAALNQRFPMDATSRQYFTLLYGVLDTHARRLQYVSAGHPAPVHLRPGQPPVVLEAAGFPIGWFPEPSYEENAVELQSGDRLYCYSDGVVEAKNAQGECFDATRLMQALEEVRALPLEASLTSLMGRIREWCGDRGPDDDVSMLALEIKEGRGGASRYNAAASS